MNEAETRVFISDLMYNACDIRRTNERGYVMANVWSRMFFPVGSPVVVNQRCTWYDWITRKSISGQPRMHRLSDQTQNIARGVVTIFALVYRNRC